MALSTPNVPAVDMNAQRRFQRDIVDTMYTAVTENRHVSFLVQSFANLLNLGESRIRAGRALLVLRLRRLLSRPK